MACAAKPSSANSPKSSTTCAIPTQAEPYRITADLAETAGSALWDVGLHQRAQQYFSLGVKAAAQAGDKPLAAHILATMAVQAVEQGHLRTGLDLIQMAQHGMRRTPMPRLDSMLATREGWICAQLGRVQDCHRAIGNAEDAFTRTTHDDAPGWLDYFSAAELAGTTASDYRDLAAHDPAQLTKAADRFERALALRGNESLRSRAFDLTELAKVQFRQGEVELACATGHAATDAAAGLNSFRVRQRLTDLVRHEPLPAPDTMRGPARTRPAAGHGDVTGHSSPSSRYTARPTFRATKACSTLRVRAGGM